MQDRLRPSSPAALLELITGSWTTQALHVAARLRVADHLAEAPMRAADLAAALDVHPDSLERLLRALASLDVCEEREPGVFALAPLGRHLCADAPDSVRSWALFWGGGLWPIWATLHNTVATGKSARALVTPAGGFDALARQPEAARAFNDAMAEATRLIAPSVVRAIDWAGVARVVDIGGGRGDLIAAVLAANPGMRGVLFDLPHALEAAEARLRAAGVADRCERVVGSFFETVPADADAYVLKSVLHDWSDDRARVILERCRAAMRPGARLLVVERVMPDRMAATAEHRRHAASDLNMMVAVSGRERRESELRALLGGAGFRVDRIVPVDFSFSVIEDVA